MVGSRHLRFGFLGLPLSDIVASLHSHYASVSDKETEFSVLVLYRWGPFFFFFLQTQSCVGGWLLLFWFDCLVFCFRNSCDIFTENLSLKYFKFMIYEKQCQGIKILFSFLGLLLLFV